VITLAVWCRAGGGQHPDVSENQHILRSYALLADGERGALIGPHGGISWLCFPGWADPAVLASLIGGGGEYEITPDCPHVWGGRYEPGSLIWRSRWITHAGVIECREALAFPGDDSRAVLLRRVEALEGPARVRVRLELAGDYGRRAPTLDGRQEGIWRGRLGGHEFAWEGAQAARHDRAGALRMALELEPGEHHDFVLVLGGDGSVPDAEKVWEETAAAWAATVPPVSAGIALRDTRHARAVLCGLTAPTGATVAAATMALPERARAGRAYDYRYAWIRDQAMIGQAAAAAGFEDMLDTSARFLAARVLEDGPTLKPAYTVRGGPVPEQVTLDLPGYPGGTDIAGNQAGEQFQLDAFGELLLCLGAADGLDRADADMWRAIEAAADAIERRRHDPDAGIWELDDRIWTHSRLICAAGLRRVASRPAAGTRAPGWLALADSLVAEAGEAVHPSGRWQRALDDERVDAALLFPPLRGAVPVDDPRSIATLDAVIEELCDDYFTYRYRHDARPLGDAEGAFLLCGFAVALLANECGRPLEAAHYFERSRSACGPPGLMSEEFDIAQRQLRGNLPQAFVHALLIETAVRLG
jgi:GH15 family glucan-1,4-alpha-glucosidase